MFLDEIKKYISEYEIGVRSIVYRTSRPKLLKEPIDLVMIQAPGNYDLFFSPKGLLLESLHFEKIKNTKVIYGYDDKGLLISAICMVQNTNELLSKSEFVYNENGIILKEVVSSGYSRNSCKVINERHHQYKGMTHQIQMTNSLEEEEDCTFYYTQDYLGRIIEEKAISEYDDLLYWYKKEYDFENNLVREISLDNNGSPDGVYEYLPNQKKQMSGYIFRSEDSNYKKEYLYTFNEKDHWTSQVVLTDDEPTYFYERILEYY